LPSVLSSCESAESSSLDLLSLSCCGIVTMASRCCHVKAEESLLPPHDHSSYSSSLSSFSCTQDTLSNKKEFIIGGANAALLLQVSHGWRHCILLQNIVLFKVCHPESNIITHVWPVVACKGTSVLIHHCIFLDYVRS
jgi:hypothetical protein